MYVLKWAGGTHHQPEVPNPIPESSASNLARPYTDIKAQPLLHYGMGFDALTSDIYDIEAPFGHPSLAKIFSGRQQGSSSITLSRANIFEVTGKDECRNICENIHRQRAFGRGERAPSKQ